jgi:hypothetical protein
MSYGIEYDKQPKRFLRKLDKHLIKRIMDKIDELLIENPIPQSAKTVVGEHGIQGQNWRLSCSLPNSSSREERGCSKNRQETKGVLRGQEQEFSSSMNNLS